MAKRRYKSKKLFFDRPWIRLAVILYLFQFTASIALPLAMYAIPSLQYLFPVPVFPPETNLLSTFGEIVSNNVIIATASLLPLVGFLYFAWSIILTYFSIGSICFSASIGPLLCTGSTFLNAIGFLEPVAYVIAATESIFLFISIFKRAFWAEVERAVYAGVIAITTLIVSGFTEALGIVVFPEPASIIYTWMLVLFVFIVTGLAFQDYTKAIFREFAYIIERIKHLMIP